MNVSSTRSIEMPSYREYREQPPQVDNVAVNAPPSEACSTDQLANAADQLPRPSAQPASSWSDSIQQINQKGWVGFALRWVPVVALCVTVMGGVFAYMNHKALDAQRTLNLVKNLQPVLIDAHKTIISALANIQNQLGLNSTNRPNSTDSSHN